MDRSYPLDPTGYRCVGVIGRGVNSVVHKAICTKTDTSVEDVAIKVIDLDKSKEDFEEAEREARFTTYLDHPNLLRAHCFFRVNNSLWVVMPFMSRGSLQSIIASSYPDGLPEACIAAVLKQVLTAIRFLHREFHVHRDIKAGNILVDESSDGSVQIKLADYGISSSVYDSSLSSDSESTMSGIRYWMAPEVIFSPTVYVFSADIWMFGVTALELAHGRPPLTDDRLPPSKSLMRKMLKISKSFKHMVGLCLDHDASKRPVARILLKHPFFQNDGGLDLLFKNIVPAADHEPELQIDRLTRKGCEEAGERVRKKMDEGILRGWKLNEEWFELDPVQETGIDAGESSDNVGGGVAKLNRALLLKLTTFLKEGLDIQKQKTRQISKLFTMTREELMQETENLKMEVENRKIEWFEFDMELQQLQKEDEND